MAKQPAGKVSVTALGQVRIFTSLEEDQLTALAEQCSWSRYEAASEILAQGTPCDKVYFICSGRVTAKTFSDGGKEITFAELVTGDIFGELSALDGRPRSSFVVTLEESLLALLAADLFNDFLDTHPQVMRALMIELAGRLRRTDEKVFEFSTLNTSNRIHAELLHLAGMHPTSDGAVQITPPPTHADLASRTNTTRESVTRTLNQLKQGGLIEATRQCLTIFDPDTLTKLIRDSEAD
tara:strand:+ start:613 stop:1326 length:714 start_codon:yes stop_codon:yes gene_type:complete